MSESFQFPDERASVGDTFRCRKCRVYLFCFDNLSPFHKKTEPVDQCSTWYIDSDEIDGSEGRDTLVWVKEAVDKSQWTEGKLYCPKCTSRIGSFNFTQGVRCSCFTYIIPAIWIQKCKVDQITACASKPNIRLPDNPDNNNSEGDINTQDRSPMLNMDTSQTGSQSSQTCSDSGQSDTKTNESGSQMKMDLGKNESMVDKEMKYSCTPCLCEQEIGLETLISGYQIDSRQTELTNCPKSDECSNRDLNNDINIKVLEKRTRNNSSSAMQGKENPSQISCTEWNHMAGIPRIHRRKINRQKKLIAEVLQFQHGESFSANGNIEEVPSSHLGRHLDRDDGSRFEMLEEMEENHDFDEKTTDHSDKHKLHHELEEIPDQVTCPVCLDLMYDPLMCPCSHMFCDSCLRILNSKSRHSVPRCPLCRKAVYCVYPATEIREEIKKCYLKAYKARHKAERRAPHRRLPLPNGRIKPRQKRSSRVPDVPMPYSVLVVLACVLACCGMCLLILFVFCPPTRNGCITVIGYEWMNGY